MLGMHEEFGAEHERGLGPDYCTCPNPQGDLMLGCVLPALPGDAPCCEGPVDCQFGIAPCRCLPTLFGHTYYLSGNTIALRPRDLVRVPVKVEFCLEQPG